MCLFLGAARLSLADEALLWHLQGPEGQELYILGSIHLAQSSIYPLKPVIMENFAKATRLVVEVNDGETGLTEI
ncbi:MAG: TraB/GumN family protein, partial [Deltaproteobacteria bacterium]|nr:TraB/GumN family protein [Deltaproteobacteria bacterium]